MFARCVADREYRQALGIALETRRLDVIKDILSTTKDQSLLIYVLEAVMGVVQNLDVRSQVLHLLVDIFKALPIPDHFSISQCYVFLNAPQLASDLFLELVGKADQGTSSSSTANTENDPLLIAYQIAFDLAESATQEFLESVRKLLQDKTGESSQAIIKTEDTSMTEGAKEESTPATYIDRIRSILLGEESIQLYLDFLQNSNQADLAILKSTKEALDARSSIYHNAMTFGNAFMNAGTTSDKFLRENLDWLAKASNWSKFTATAALGVINKGNLKEGISILRPYLPQDGVSSSVYSEGGSLFALGLIHANHGTDVIELLKNTLKGNTAEIVQHGAALGLGAAGMASGNEEVYDELRNVLYTDSAVAGEACGYAMGLIMLGTGSERAVEEMLTYAHETQHEKIIRGLSIGLALLFYGREERADAMIDTLMSEKDAILRYGGIYTIALAYAGTGNNKAIRRLLHVAVSDVNDDVRRAAVTSLGFLLFRNPTQVPRIVELLSQSFNPHVRYGSTLALGIACAGTGLNEAVDLLQPMINDPVDFVRQGACIALAMIMIQQNENLNPGVVSVRASFEKILTDKHEDAMAKFGAALAQGIMDAGGRNVTISLVNKGSSNNSMTAIVGMALFTQFWYWFPLGHFVSLAFTPTAIIGLDRQLRIPKFEFKSNARPSLFNYPVAAKKESEKKVEKVETAVLSTTAKSQARQRVKEREKAKEERGESMEVDDAGAADGKKDDADDKSKDASKKAKRERKSAEPSFSMVPNYSRVTPSQLKYITFPPESRYLPIRPINGGDKQPDVYNTSTVAPNRGKLSVLGTASPLPGDSGRVTPNKEVAAKNASSTASSLQSGPSAQEARSISSSRVRSNGGILLLIDRKSSDEFEPLRADNGPENGQTEAAASVNPFNNDPRAPSGSDISPEDQAAIQRALAMDDEGQDDDKDVTGVHGNNRDNNQGGGAAPAPPQPEAR
jgi:26S proteasome regulatory subunit N2